MWERVLIVAKTRMKSGFCVSGLVCSSNANIRLKPEGQYKHSEDTLFEVGQLWDLEFQHPTWLQAPHMEDVIVTRQQYIGQIHNLCETLLPRVRPWRGGPQALYDSMLSLENKKYYVSAIFGPIPHCSTGYWLPDQALILNRTDPQRLYYEYHDQQTNKCICSIKFVGLIEAVVQIPAETLVRVSLSRWRWYDFANEQRCYLQVSGWYL
jgi:hypothetical protein